MQVSSAGDLFKKVICIKTGVEGSIQEMTIFLYQFQSNYALPLTGRTILWQ
uniref:Uncharacterized protein n=1 Tax=Rhizophora mucronata TaxID=61149 RepID=A0A2P2NT65_RHIMU